MWMTGDGVNRQDGPVNKGCHLSVIKKAAGSFITPGARAKFTGVDGGYLLCFSSRLNLSVPFIHAAAPLFASRYKSWGGIKL